MAETTFWPTGEQVERLARTHSPGDEGLGLVQTQTPFIHYPLTDPLRTAMPAGGLFSTASDIAKFCRMILNGGKWGGWRYLSEKAVKLMTSRQTAPGLSGYGLGWAVEDDCCGHGGALSTMMMIYPDRGLALVYLVQHMGFPGEGGNAYGAFRDAALAQFSPCAAGNS
jgi:CubicO group peptidase (beta-lactamase class C family)